MWDGKEFARACSSGESSWELLGGFADAWAEPGIPRGFPLHSLRLGENALGRPLPSALRRWYIEFANHPCLSNSRQDQLRTPDRLQAQHGMVTFLVENQGVWRIAIRESDLGQDDPPVLWSYEWGPGAKWDLMNSRFSRFALRWAVYSALFESGFGAAGSSHQVDISKLFSATTPIQFPEPPLLGGSVRFRAAEDVLIQEQDFEKSGDCDYIMIYALSQSACDWAKSLIKVDWD